MTTLWLGGSRPHPAVPDGFPAAAVPSGKNVRLGGDESNRPVVERAIARYVANTGLDVTDSAKAPPASSKSASTRAFLGIMATNGGQPICLRLQPHRCT